MELYILICNLVTIGEENLTRALTVLFGLLFAWLCLLAQEVSTSGWIRTEKNDALPRRLNHSDGEAEKFYRNLTACAWVWRPPDLTPVRAGDVAKLFRVMRAVSPPQAAPATSLS